MWAVGFPAGKLVRNLGGHDEEKLSNERGLNEKVQKP